MKKISSILVHLFIIWVLFSCSKEKPSSQESPKSIATLTTNSVSDIKSTSAICGGSITADGGATVTVRGVCWATSSNPTLANNKTTDGSGLGNFISNIDGLVGSTLYHVRAYATNSVGTAYGTDISFTTSVAGIVPTISTTVVSGITAFTATSGGNITVEGTSTVTARGVCWSTDPNPTLSNSKTTDGAGAGNFSSSLSGLNGGTIYYVKAYATNSIGTGYGMALSFKTLGQVPTVTTLAATIITTVAAQFNGSINANYLSTVVTFEYGTTTSYGSTITATQSPLTGSTNTNVSANITGLTAATIYHYRITAVNSLGTTYGADITFTTILTGIPGTLSDNDGNTYQTISIGYQVWMAENLKTTKFNDGTAIPNVTRTTPGIFYDEQITWSSLTTPAYCWYNNNAGYKATYGALYNWYTVDATSNGSKNVCPTGWHVPTDAEWTTLTTYLGGEAVAGGKLKETGTTHWITPNTGATNETGFTALPGGYRYTIGTFNGVGSDGYWWSSTEYSTNAWVRTMSYYFTRVGRGSNYKQDGYSVRCVRDF